MRGTYILLTLLVAPFGGVVEAAPVAPKLSYQTTSLIGDGTDAVFVRHTRSVKVAPVFGGKTFADGFRLPSAARSVRKSRHSDARNTVATGRQDFVAPATLLTGSVDIRDFAPTATLGYGGSIAEGLRIGIDAGAAFQAMPHLRDLSSSGGFGGNPSLSNAGDNGQRENGRIRDFKLYPVAQLSLGYAF